MPDPENRWTRKMNRVRERLGIKASRGSAGAGGRLEEQELDHVGRRPAGAREVPPYGVTALDAPVFFVVGRAKSGTSWLMRMLDAHPEVLCRGEGRFFGRDYERGVPARARTGRDAPQRSLHGALADSEHLRAWIERSAWKGEADVEEHLGNVTGLITDYFLKKGLHEADKKIVGDKTPFTGAHVVREMAEIRPDAKLVHVIRDGRDVAISSVHHVWNNARQEGGLHDLPPEELAKRDAYRADPKAFVGSGESIFTERRLRGTAKSWTEMVGRAVEDGPRLLGEDHYAEVRYEDLLERPEEEVGRLLRFLGADADEGAVRRCVEGASFEKRTKGRERGQEDPKAFLRKGVAGDWRNVFTERDRQVFKREAGDLLIKLGYEKDHDW